MTDLKFDLIHGSALRSLATGSVVPDNEIKFVKNYRQGTEQILMTPKTLFEIIEGNLGSVVKENLQKVSQEAEVKRKEYNQGKADRMNKQNKINFKDKGKP